MRNEIKVPSMGESISEATVGQILAVSGKHVIADEEIIELETDKVNQILYAPHAGKVAWQVQSGESVKIGQLLGFLEVEEQENKSAQQPVQAPKQEMQTLPSTGLRMGKREFAAAFREIPKEETVPPDALLQPSVASKKGERRETRRPLSKIRKAIGERLLEAKQKTAMLTTFNEVDLSQIIDMRSTHQELFTKKFGTKLGYMSFFIKATVSALEAFPELNAYLQGDEIVYREYYDIGVAVGTEKGTFVPVLRSCDQLSFAQIEQLIDQYAKKAREGTIAYEDLIGGGFTITNGGVYGSLLSTPLLNPPQCAILGMHKIEKRPVVVEDQIVIRPMMYLALSYDHRLIDGRESVSFLAKIKAQLEDPSRFLLEL